MHFCSGKDTLLGALYLLFILLLTKFLYSWVNWVLGTYLEPPSGAAGIRTRAFILIVWWCSHSAMDGEPALYEALCSVLPTSILRIFSETEPVWYCCPYLTGEETEAYEVNWLSQGEKASPWSGQDLELVVVEPKSKNQYVLGPWI